MTEVTNEVHDKSIGDDVLKNAIKVVVDLMGHGDIFHRVVDEIIRTNEAMPNATGKEKRARFFAECTIIFDDLVVPVAESTLRLLLEIGLKYIAASVIL